MELQKEENLNFNLKDWYSSEQSDFIDLFQKIYDIKNEKLIFNILKFKNKKILIRLLIKILNWHKLNNPNPLVYFDKQILNNISYNNDINDFIKNHEFIDNLYQYSSTDTGAGVAFRLERIFSNFTCRAAAIEVLKYNMGKKLHSSLELIYSKYKIIEQILELCNSGYKSGYIFYKIIEIKNITDKIQYLYYYNINEDLPEYSLCYYIESIEPGDTKDISVTSNPTILSSEINLGYTCYYNDIKSSIILDLKITNNIKGIEIRKPKTELQKWKEAALKQNFILNELKRLGIEKNPNFECIIDLQQDIYIPEFSELDKELAGIPSVFTNIT